MLSITVKMNSDSVVQIPETPREPKMYVSPFIHDYNIHAIMLTTFQETFDTLFWHYTKSM